MAKLNLRKDDDPILRKKSKPIDVFDDQLAALASDMIETMLENDGVGLAAVQIGKLRQLITYDQHDERGSFVLVNPRITEFSGAERGLEGCLSVTETTGQVIRPTRIRVEAQDLRGEPFSLVAEGMLARILCHEIDHLEGVLFIDKMLPPEDKQES